MNMTLPEKAGEAVNQGLVLLTLAFLLFLAISCAVRLLRSRFAPVKTVKAQVIRKTKQEVFSGPRRSARYVVVFSAGEKTLSFYVSAFSYELYRVNERGTLTYRGGRLIEFR